MHKNNITYVFLIGFQGLHQFKMLLFFSMLIIYCLTICGNVLIITLVSLSRNLHSPMYIFISQVSLSDILLTTAILPNMFSIVLHEGSTMSLKSCIAQFFFFANVEAWECLLLTVMSYDRYLAICKPFLYSSTMNDMFCIKAIIFAWLLSCFMIIVNSIAMCNLTFCGANVIDHFFCDFTPLINLACSDISIVHMQTIIITVSVIIFPFIVIVVSYVYIVLTILRIPSITKRKKAFSTCSSHLTVVSIFYGTLISVYVVPPRGQLLTVNKVLSLLYTAFTPMLNPIIYTLRNKDFKEAFRKYICYSSSV
ncbi:olfactory receptor 11L1-like [Pseudophryne corroboree]|uniref:olfactory receptor 11L1-like n=1 Tax=Pseudophryne corroboree TaxID=495146 RepID=UPI003081FC6B